jgi:hypothetical protein
MKQATSKTRKYNTRTTRPHGPWDLAKQKRFEAAEDRKEAYDKLTPLQKLIALGPHKATRQRAKLEALIEKAKA